MESSNLTLTSPKLWFLCYLPCISTGWPLVKQNFAFGNLIGSPQGVPAYSQDWFGKWNCILGNLEPTCGTSMDLYCVNHRKHRSIKIFRIIITVVVTHISVLGNTRWTPHTEQKFSRFHLRQMIPTVMSPAIKLHEMC